MKLTISFKLFIIATLTSGSLSLSKILAILIISSSKSSFAFEINLLKELAIACLTLHDSSTPVISLTVFIILKLSSLSKYFISSPDVSIAIHLTIST